MNDSPKSGLSLPQKVIQTLFVNTVSFFLGILRCQEGVAFLDLVYLTGSDVTGGTMFFTAAAAGFVIGVMMLGPLFDSLNNDALFLICTLMAAITTLAIPWAKSLQLMVILFALRGVFVGPADSGCSVMTERTWHHQAGPFFQGVQFLFAVGGILGPYVTEQFLMEHCKMNATTGDCLPQSRTYKPIPKFHYYDVNNNGSEAALNFSSQLDSTMSAKPESLVHIAFAIPAVSMIIVCILYGFKMCFFQLSEVPDQLVKQQNSDEGTSPSTTVLTCGDILAWYALLAIHCFAYGCITKLMIHFVTAFVEEYLRWNTTDGARASGVYWAGFALGRFFGIFLAKIFKARTILLSTQIVTVLIFVTMLFVDYLPCADAIWWALIGGSGLMLAPLFGSKLSWADTTVTPVTAKLVSFFFLWDFAGYLAHVNLLGYLFETYTPMWFVYLILSYSILMFTTFAILCLLSHRFARRDSLCPN